MSDDAPAIAVFRPDDERLEGAEQLLATLGAEAVLDPMLSVDPTGARPRADAAYTILTSTTGVDLLPDDWTPGGQCCAIGETTAGALREDGYTVDIVPGKYTSAGLVDRLEGEVDGARVEVARSDHGSAVLLEGLEAAGAYVHETILYRLTRPDGAGVSAERATARSLDAALFSSSLTVDHLLEAAEERGIREETVAGLNEALVGAIGPPTAETAANEGIEVDFVAETADFEVLARSAVQRLDT